MHRLWPGVSVKHLRKCLVAGANILQFIIMFIGEDKVGDNLNDEGTILDVLIIKAAAPWTCLAST
jgi:hypothetical protein